MWNDKDLKINWGIKNLFYLKKIKKIINLKILIK